jgi:phosphoribosyl 1,2-cyclic phosphodiesterase
MENILKTPNVLFGTLYSGSKGNCSIVRINGTTVLVDAGRSAKYLCARLAACGIAPDEVDAVFITHSHVDHTSALATLTKKYGIPIYAAGAVAREIAHLCAEGTLNAHPLRMSVSIGEITVSSFATSHDTYESVGYRFESEGRAFGVATDLGVVTDEVKRGLCGCSAAVIEANHDVEMLMSGPYPPELKRRILSARGHLSNESCAEFAVYLASQGASSLLLAHVSEINNSLELARAATERALCDSCHSVTINVALPDEPVLLQVD